MKPTMCPAHQRINRGKLIDRAGRSCWRPSFTYTVADAIYAFTDRPHLSVDPYAAQEAFQPAVSCEAALWGFVTLAGLPLAIAPHDASPLLGWAEYATGCTIMADRPRSLVSSIRDPISRCCIHRTYSRSIRRSIASPAKGDAASSRHKPPVQMPDAEIISPLCPLPSPRPTTTFVPAWLPAGPSLWSSFQEWWVGSSAPSVSRPVLPTAVWHILAAIDVPNTQALRGWATSCGPRWRSWAVIDIEPCVRASDGISPMGRAVMGRQH